MKRNAKKIVAFALTAILTFSLGFQTVTASDYSGHWAKEYIDFVKSSGYWTDEGDFMPDKAITRAEFSALLARTLGAAIVEIVPDFDDVDINTPYVYEIYSAYHIDAEYLASLGATQAPLEIMIPSRNQTCLLPFFSFSFSSANRLSRLFINAAKNAQRTADETKAMIKNAFSSSRYSEL